MLTCAIGLDLFSKQHSRAPLSSWWRLLVSFRSSIASSTENSMYVALSHNFLLVNPSIAQISPLVQTISITVLSTSNWCLALVVSLPTPFWALPYVVQRQVIGRRLDGIIPFWGPFTDRTIQTCATQSGCVQSFSSWFIWASRHSWSAVSVFALQLWIISEPGTV